MEKKFRTLYDEALGQFDHGKPDLLEVMGIPTERAQELKDKLEKIIDSDLWKKSDSEMLQHSLYEAEPQNLKETLLVGYMIGVLKQLDSHDNL